MIVKTRNGVFSNQGYGGGTFNQNTAFGAVPARSNMRRHRYGDVSNLNAPYDNLSLQGIRGVGSLSGTSLGAMTLDELDASNAEDDKAAGATTYPWMQESSATSAIQTELNKQLAADGMHQLLVDGRLGGRTCGALVKYGALDMVFGACDGHEAEFIAPITEAQWQRQQGGGTVSDGAAADEGMVNPEPKGMPGWAWGVLLGVGAIAAITYMKKRKGRSVTLSTSYG
jgi:hypothetical protein